jgi:hypothetical protein
MTKKKKPEEKKKTGRPTDYGPHILTATREYINNARDRYESTVQVIKPIIDEDNEDENEDTKEPREVIGPPIFIVNLPTVAGLALHLGINKDTVQEWRKIHPEFSVLVGEVLAKQEQALISGGLNGTYNPTITKLILHKHGYVDKAEVEQKGSFLGDIFDAAAKRRKETEDEEEK